jgi:uncharacterized membrane protein YoaK (UPF0700 family)
VFEPFELVAAFRTASPSPEAMSQVPALRSIWDLFVIECVFTVSGGFMDAYSFIAHGHVFANAQTGNVVFFAVYATEGNWFQAIRHVPPIVACILGVSAARLLGVRAEKQTFRATLLCQGIELAVLSGLALFASRLPDDWVVPIISFAVALQITSFDALGPWSFNSAMTTSNIKNATTGFVLWLIGKERAKNRGRAIVSTAACLSFLLGALFGGFYTYRHEAHALTPVVFLVLTGLLLTWRKRQINTKQARSK